MISLAVESLGHSLSSTKVERSSWNDFNNSTTFITLHLNPSGDDHAVQHTNLPPNGD